MVFFFVLAIKTIDLALGQSLDEACCQIQRMVGPFSGPAWPFFGPADLGSLLYQPPHMARQYSPYNQAALLNVPTGIPALAFILGCDSLYATQGICFEARPARTQPALPVGTWCLRSMGLVTNKSPSTPGYDQHRFCGCGQLGPPQPMAAVP